MNINISYYDRFYATDYIEKYQYPLKSFDVPLKAHFFVVTDEQDIFLWNPRNGDIPYGFRRVWIVDGKLVDDEVGWLHEEFWSLEEL